MCPSYLKDKVAFITGSTKGIGWATAQVFAAQGASIILNGHADASLLKARVDELKALHQVAVSGILADVADPDQINSCYREILQTYGRLDIVVNNAGIMQPALLGLISEKVMHESFNLNALSVVHSLQAASKLMRRQKGGSIINISSILGMQGCAGQVVYAGTKAAVIGITKAAAKELAAFHIRVNCVAPGFIHTDLTANQSLDICQQIKMGRMGDPREVANAILFFASPLSEYVTGQVLGVDGGMII